MLAGVDPSTTSIGAYSDAAWAAHVDYVLAAQAAGGQPVTEAIDAAWHQMATPTGSPSASLDGPSSAPSSQSAPTGPPRFDPPIDPETGQPRRPTAAEREAWALRAGMSGTNDLLGASPGARSGAADRVGG